MQTKEWYLYVQWKLDQGFAINTWFSRCATKDAPYTNNSMMSTQGELFWFNELIVIWDQQHQIWFLSSCKRRNIDHIWDHHLVAPDEDGSHAAGIALWPTFPQELSAEIYHGSCIQRVQTIIKKFKIAKKKKKRCHRNKSNSESLDARVLKNRFGWRWGNWKWKITKRNGTFWCKIQFEIWNKCPGLWTTHTLVLHEYEVQSYILKSEVIVENTDFFPFLCFFVFLITQAFFFKHS